MKYNPEKHHRRSIRLQGYDYSQLGFYFVTICTWQREHLLGDVINFNVKLSRFGEAIQYNWRILPNKFKALEIDEFVIIPNHIHGILHITQDNQDSLSEIVRNFKTSSARRVNQLRGTKGIPVWQRNYYEHIIRDQNSLEKIREYISNNPLVWKRDKLNLNHSSNIDVNDVIDEL
ncbi:MAG: transposase [Leptolyngbyaceae cyanobacterium]